MALRSDDQGISKVLKKPLLNREWHREPEFMSILKEYLNKDEIFFDLGCNIGYVSLFVLKNISSNGYLYAIDPDKKNIFALKESIKRNKLGNNFSTEVLAMSSEDGEIGFEFSNKSNLHKINNKLSKNDPSYKLITSKKFDSYFSNKSLPNFIKMDVEGAEIEILIGMKHFIESSHKCKILMELHPQKYNDENYEKSFELLFKNGFKVKKFITSSRAYNHPLLKGRFVPSQIVKSGPFSRAVYDDFPEEYFRKAVLNKIPFKARSNFISYLKKPQFIFKPYLKTKKLARAALFIR